MGYPEISGEGQEKEGGAIAKLDAELERTSMLLERLRVRLTPVLNQFDSIEKASDAPRAEPATPFLHRVERLDQMNTSLQSLINDIDL
jgi:hypothetical protein